MAGWFLAMRRLLQCTSISVILMTILFHEICLALYEDQVGLFDWRQQYIGKVKFAYFDQHSHSSRRALVATESNVIAALNARTGSIIWRKVFESNHGNVDALLHHATTLISVSGFGKMLRSWEANKGHLQWETGRPEALAPARNIAGFPTWGATLFDRKAGQSSSGVVVLYNNAVYMHSIVDGSVIWSWSPKQDSTEQIKTSCLALHIIMDDIYVIMQKNEILMEIAVLNSQKGVVKESRTIPAPWLIHNSTKCAIVGYKYVACINVEESNIEIIDLQSKEIDSASTPFSSVFNNSPENAEFSITAFNYQFEHSKFIVKVSPDTQFLLDISRDTRKVEVLHQFKNNVLMIASNAAASKPVIILLESGDKEQKITAYDFNEFTEIPKLSQKIQKGNGHGKPEYGTIYTFTKKDGELGYRLLVAFEDHALCLIQQSGTILWEREEALAGIAAIEMIELPASTSASKLELLHEEFSSFPNAGILSMFIKRVKIQLKQFELLMANLKKRKHYGFPSNSSKEQPNFLTRDQFGLHKIIVAITDSGKLFGLDTSKGKVLWSRFLNDLTPYHPRGEKNIMLYVQRTTAHFPLPPQCVVVAQRKSGHGTLVFAFNPLTGQPADAKNPNGIIFPYDIVQVSLLPLTDEKFCKAILLVDDKLKVHIFPETDESVSHLFEKLNTIYLHLIDQEARTVRGFMLKGGKQTGKEVAGITEAWSVKFPDDQKIHRIAYKRLDEHIDSVGRVLGDRSVLYKYLNPNLLAFAAVTRDAAKPSTFIYVLDAVTGQIVYQTRHRNARGPVQMILSENWLVYLYYNTKSRRTEVSVLEMFEGFEEKNSTAFSSLESLDQPLVLSQGYLLPVISVSAMAVTNTERGITHKNLLMAIENGYLYSVPKSFLDPRRSFQQTAELAEEGLMPYVPELPLHPMAFVNYNMTVEKVRGIHTSAAGLESTSLVLAYGLDLYFTRVTPSKLFDVLKEDFDYIFISGVLSALILGTIISSKLASVRKLNLSWL